VQFAWDYLSRGEHDQESSYQAGLRCAACGIAVISGTNSDDKFVMTRVIGFYRNGVVAMPTGIAGGFVSNDVLAADGGGNASGDASTSCTSFGK